MSSVEEDGGAGELNAGEERLGELVVARGDGSELFELVEEPSMRLRSQERAKSHGRGVFRLDLEGMTGAIARSLRAAMKASASKAMSAIRAPGSTASISGSAQVRS